MKSKIFIISFLIATSIIYSQRDIKIISSDFKSITIEYTPIYSDTSDQYYDGKTFKNVDLFLGRLENSEKWGEPGVMLRNLEIGVPSEFGNSIEVLSTIYRQINGQLTPIPTPIPDTFSVAFDYKLTPEYYSYQPKDDLVSFGEFGFRRDIGSQTIIIRPIKFYPQENKIILYSKIIFKVNFSSAGNLSSKPASDLLDGRLLNYDVAKFWNNSTDKNSLTKKTIINSVLASGKWIRFEASEEGIYKITKSELGLYGIDANTVDPRTIKIFNNSGKPLPENNSLERPVDLEENAIIVVGENDGKFDDADYILFYGRGSKFWDYDTEGTTVIRYNNPYSSKNYFWITSGGANGKRMSEIQNLNSTADFIQTNTDAFTDWEEDRINIGNTGRQFLGDNFSTSVPSRTYTNNLTWRDGAFPVKYNTRFVVGSKEGLSLQIKENGTQILSRTMNGYGSALYVVGYEYTNSLQFLDSILDNRSVLNFSISNASAGSIGYLDYFTIQYKKYLKPVSNNLLFFSDPNNGVVEYQTSGFDNSGVSVFNITNHSDVKKITGASISGGDCKFRISETSNSRSKYLLLTEAGFKKPSNQIEISNSNLHGELVGAKYIIVTHKDFKEAAEQLKSYKENEAPVKISTYIAYVDEIFNEFSGGIIDPSGIRDYLKYAYDNWQTEPEYVLMLGKGTYDYKNIEGYNDNFVPTWQSIESLYLINSYTTDDYFGRISGSDTKVDIAMGRITCSNLSDAKVVVDKIRDYELNHLKGSWRNLITLVSDDGCKSRECTEGAMHTSPNENLANNYFPASFDFKKIYSAAYPDVITGQGRRRPDVNQEIINSINQGALFVNYFGHGSPELWADEHIFDKSISLPLLENDKYFFLGAATCDFSYFDIPNYQSAGEALVMLPNKGAIASFSSTRLVYSGANEFLMRQFVIYLFNSAKDSLGLNTTIGKAALNAKETDINDQKYVLLGDPTLRLLVPQYTAEIDSINGNDLSANVQIKALSTTKIQGSVLHPDNTLWNDFNGEGTLTIYDSKRQVRIEPINFNVTMPGGVIFNGRVSITNGKFETEFVVPKDISYENKNGKIVLYFSDNIVDGLGYTNKIIVGGTDSTRQNDGDGPAINIYFDDISNTNGTLVNSDSKLIVELSDETGINATGTGVGHKLEGILNQETQNPIDFTDYFTGDLDAGGKSGKVDYKFSNLENGDNQLKVKAWDVFNNPSEEEVFFTVVDGSNLEIQDVYNYPNPFKEKTQFTFQQNLSIPIDIKIKVYTIAGRFIKEIEKQNVQDRFVVIDWDGMDNDGDRVANGTYLYKIIVKSIDGSFNKSVLGKLAVLN